MQRASNAMRRASQARLGRVHTIGDATGKASTGPIRGTIDVAYQGKSRGFQVDAGIPSPCDAREQAEFKALMALRHDAWTEQFGKHMKG